MTWRGFGRGPVQQRAGDACGCAALALLPSRLCYAVGRRTRDSRSLSWRRDGAQAQHRLPRIAASGRLTFVALEGRGGPVGALPMPSRARSGVRPHTAIAPGRREWNPQFSLRGAGRTLRGGKWAVGVLSGNAKG